jgi:hypothetical protein
VDNKNIVDKLKHDISSANILELNVVDVVIEYALLAYFDKAVNGETISIADLSNLLKIGYALLLLQIAARVIYEQNEFYIKDRDNELIIDRLISMVKNMDAKLMISGQPIETSTRFVEGSLSYLRKITALIYILSERDQGNIPTSYFYRAPSRDQKVV